MSSLPLPDLRRSDDDHVVAGVCAGIAEALGVDPTLVRLLFAVLTLASGAGIVLYAAAWLLMTGRAWAAALTLIAASGLALGALGVSGRGSLALVLIAAGLVVIWRRGGSLRPGAPLSFVGVALAAGGIALLLTHGSGTEFLAPGAVGGALVLIGGPWLWQLARERDAERTSRIRSEERADVAAHVHDSVLQTLALIQRHADDSHRVGALARRQERELRSWLYGTGETSADTLGGALAEAATEIEDLHAVRIELAIGGDCPLDARLEPIVLAAREAMTNAAKFSGADEISVYLEAGHEAARVFIRDRGRGFDRSAVPPDRRGLAESIEGRMARAGGTAVVAAETGSGTEIELTLPRSPS
jgi:signal transduction histidine kinase